MGDPGRLKLLRKLSPGHRHGWVRVVTIGLTLVTLVLVPALGVARVDVIGGAHHALGRRVDWLTGLCAVAIAIAGFYVVTFLLNAVLGRVFCGWGCPVGHTARVADWIERAPRGKRLGRQLAGVAWALALAGAITPWWLSPVQLLALPAWLALASAVWLHGRYWRWSFCRRICPIGLYYSAVQTRHAFGIQFERAAGCIDCDACARVCPVGLDARDLSRVVSGVGGLSIDDMPARNHCLTCSDCVRACELVLHKRELRRLPLRLGRPRAAS